MSNIVDKTERIVQNMAYLDGQINRSILLLDQDYDDVCRGVYSDKEPSATFTPAKDTDFKTAYSKEEYAGYVSKMEGRISYIQECISELEKFASMLPEEEPYDDAFISDFIERVSVLNTNTFIRTGNQRVKRSAVQPRADDQLTTNYKLSDFKCKNGTEVPSKYAKYTKILAQGLETYANKLGVNGKFQINSAYRTSAYDKQVGGNGKGLHVVAAAADLQIPKGTSKQNAFNIAAKCGFSGVIIYPNTNHIHVDIRKQCEDSSAHGTTYYSTNGAKSGTKAPEGAIDSVEGVDMGGTTSGGNNSGGSGGSGGSGDFYGPSQAIEWVERTPDPSISKIIVPNGMASWGTISGALKVSEATLKKLNPGIKTLFPGTTLFIPSSAVAQARELASKANNAVFTYKTFMDTSIDAYEEVNMIQSLSNEENQSSPNSRSSTVEATPFQTFRNNKDYIKTYDMKEFNDKKEAYITIEYNGKSRRIETLISPINLTETYANSINVHQTAGGWFISRHGENLAQINLNGYMLDTKLAPEKHVFMSEFQNYMTDKVNKTTGDYENNAIIKITVEGVEYQGHVTTITFNKDANRPLLYSFSLAFLCVQYRSLRNVTDALNILNSRSSGRSGTEIYMGSSLLSVMQK